LVFVGADGGVEEKLVKREIPPSDYWVQNIERQGSIAYGDDPNYNYYRNIRDYGAVGLAHHFERLHPKL